MTLPTPLPRQPAKRRPEQTKTPPAKLVVVHPDQITQRDRRPWNQSSLENVVIRFILVSTVIVAIGAGLIALALFKGS
ncbi:MAG: hypothetical protein Q7T23_15080 [Phenylobacterium sp.]|nr:hypothetical protein [Phenylobacterium sp.]